MCDTYETIDLHNQLFAQYLHFMAEISTDAHH